MSRRADRDRRRQDRERAEAQVDAELRFHRDATIDELLARGLSREQAEAEARRRFGPAPAYRHRLVDLDIEHLHRQRRRAAMHLVAVGVRAMFRDIRRSPGFTLGIVTILTLGLGVNAVTFGLVDRLVLSGPAGIREPGELRRVVEHRRSGNGAALAATELGYVDYRDLLQVSDLAGAAGESTSTLLFGSGDDAERIRGLFVTANYFPLLGVSPALGRFFTDEESARDGARVVVLSQAFWERHFGGEAAVLGRVLPIEGHRYSVVGIAPRDFTGTSVARVDVFLPLEAAADEQVEGPWRTSRNFRWMGAIVRLAPGRTVSAAAAEATAVHRRALADVADVDHDASFELVPLNPVAGPASSDAVGLAGLVGTVSILVLLIAVANAANLFLARALRRRETIAVRLALGGDRWRLIGEQAAEGASLALVAAAVAVLVAWFGAPALERLVFPQVAWIGRVVSARMLVAIGVAALVGGTLAAALPMWQAGRADLASWLKTGAQRGPMASTRTQAAMLAVQGALSALLLVGAGLFVRSMTEAQALRLGIDADRVLVVSIAPGHQVAPDFAERLRADVARVPGVESTTRSAGTLPFVSSWAVHLTVPGLPERPRVDDGGPYINAVEPDYFRVVGTRVLEGRAFTKDDRLGAPRVAIVNQAMAHLYWPGESALGKCLQIGPEPAPCSTIVGIAEDTRREEILGGDSLLYYVPIDQSPDDLRTSGRLLVRAAAADEETVGRIAASVRRDALTIDPALRYVSARSLEDIVSPQLRSWRLGAGLFGAFSILALVVATIGLYSVVAFNVEGRRREMGIRAVLGATAPSLLGLVVRDSLRAAAGGILAGLAIAWLAAPLIGSLLYGVPPHDPRVFAATLMTLAAAAIAAGTLPGLRAGRVQPSAALRDQ